jgi:hypothetical protein
MQQITGLYTIHHLIIHNRSSDYTQYITSLYVYNKYNRSSDYIQHITTFYTTHQLIVDNTHSFIITQQITSLYTVQKLNGLHSTRHVIMSTHNIKPHETQ